MSIARRGGIGPDSRSSAVAVQVLHDDEVAAVDLGDVGDRDDVVVADPRRAARLAVKSADRLAVLGVAIEDDLDRDPLVEPDVVGLVDRAHPALADQPLDQIPAVELPADQRIRNALVDDRAAVDRAEPLALGVLAVTGAAARHGRATLPKDARQAIGSVPEVPLRGTVDSRQ
jgi:hypothetical protein